MTKSSVVLQGLVHVSGPFGVGKSSLGWTASTDPTKIVYIDGGTSKERPIANSLRLKIVSGVGKEISAGSYVDLGNMVAGKNDLEAFKIARGVIKSLPDGLDAVILDDVYPLFVGAHAYVRENRTEFRSGDMKGSGEMVGGMEWQAVRKMLLPGLYTVLQNKAVLVLFLSREKPARGADGTVLPGATVPDADISLNAASQLTIRLTNNTRDAQTNVPAGLVIKNARTIIPAERKVVQVFPKRIPVLAWDDIAHYLAEPVGDRVLLEAETPDDAEIHAIWGMLTPGQQEEYTRIQQLALAGVREAMEAAVKAKYEELGIPNKIAAVTAVMNELVPTYPLLDKDFVEAVIE